MCACFQTESIDRREFPIAARDFTLGRFVPPVCASPGGKPYSFGHSPTNKRKRRPTVRKPRTTSCDNHIFPRMVTFILSGPPIRRGFLGLRPATPYRLDTKLPCENLPCPPIHHGRCCPRPSTTPWPSSSAWLSAGLSLHRSRLRPASPHSRRLRHTGSDSRSAVEGGTVCVERKKLPDGREYC